MSLKHETEYKTVLMTS
jgi:hypothetical protein